MMDTNLARFVSLNEYEITPYTVDDTLDAMQGSCIDRK